MSALAILAACVLGGPLSLADPLPPPPPPPVCDEAIDVCIEQPDPLKQQAAISHAAKLSGPPGCRGSFAGCEPWVDES